MRREEAEKKALEVKPNHKVFKTVELEKCFVVSLVPNEHDTKNGLYIGGGIRVDKKTGECRLYNPMLEGIR